jgi:hypothetical protein
MVKPLNVYPGQNSRRHVFLIEIQPNAYNIYLSQTAEPDPLVINGAGNHTHTFKIFISVLHYIHYWVHYRVYIRLYVLWLGKVSNLTRFSVLHCNLQYSL